MASAAERAAPASARPLPADLDRSPPAAGPLGGSAREVARCERCGARVTLEPPALSGPCAFCATPTVVEPPAGGDMIAPDAVAALTVPREQAAHSIRRWLKERFHCPDDVARLARIEALTGMYLPFWSFDVAVSARYSARVSGDGRVPEKKTGEIAQSYDNVLVYAGSGLPPKDWHRVLDAEEGDLMGLHPGFLRGIPAEAATLSLAAGYERGKARLEEFVEADCRRDLGLFKGALNFKVDHLEIQHAAYRQILLPLWVAVYHYGGRTYRCLVGGHSGLVYGEAPKSWLKLAFTALSSALLVSLLGWVVIAALG